MHRFRTTALILVIVAAFGIGAFGASGLLSQPYTDQQIRASLADTWVAEAWSASAALFLLVLAIVISLALAYRGARSTKQLSAVSVVCAVLASALVFLAHIALTTRVTHLTGQSFGAFYGLL